jgi:tol-pal system protein YbgF
VLSTLFVIVKFLSTISLLTVSCATVSSDSEVASLKASLAALRAENAKLEQRLASLHQQGIPSGPTAITSKTPPAPVNADVGDISAVPSLTVVRMKPKREMAPKLSTSVAVVEPSVDVLAQLPLAPTEKADEALEAELAEAQFDEGLQALKTGNAEGGIAKLQTFSKRFPLHAKADNALYFVGVGYMAQKEFLPAAKAFGEAVERYPAGDVVLDSKLRLAECHVKLNQSAEARLTYQQIVDGFPGTTAAKEASVRLVALRK